MSHVPQPTLVAITRRSDGSLLLQTADGREFVARNEKELWGDLTTIMSAPALPGAPGEPEEEARSHRVTAEPIPGSGGDVEFSREHLEQGVRDAADVFEEAAAQEWGMIGRLGAQLVRKHGPEVARNFSPRTRSRRSRGRS